MPERHSHDHLSDEQLLLYADGEAGARETQTVRRHVEACWSCRSRLQKMQSAIAEYADLRGKTDTASPPKGWREFEVRLNQVEIEGNERFDLRCWIGGLLIPRPRVRLKLASALAALCCLLLIYRTVNAPTVLAKELCERTEAAERALLSSDHVLRERLQVQASGAGLERTVTRTVETWRSASGERLRHEGVAPLPDDLRRLLRTNGMGGLSPLSARSFSTWRSSIRPSAEEVTRSWRSGEGQVYEVRTQITRVHRPWRIRESRLTVRAADWLPLALAWSVATPEGERIIEITSIERELVATDRLVRLLASRTTDAASSAAKSRPLQPETEKPAARLPALTSVPDLTDLHALEIDAGYALHREDLCYSGSVEIRRESKRVIVRGIVPTAADLEKLADLLPDAPELAVELRSIEELDATIPVDSSDEPPAVITTSGAAKSPIEKYLRAYFAEYEQNSNVGQQVTDYLYRVVRLSHDMRREAWALRRITERHGEQPADDLEFSHRRKLEIMISDHTAQLHAQTRRSRELLGPVLAWCAARIPAEDDLPPLPPASDAGGLSWSARTLDLAGRAERFGRLMRTTFVNPGPEPVTLSTGIAEMIACLDRLEDDSASAVAVLDNDFLSPPIRVSREVGIE